MQHGAETLAALAAVEGRTPLDERFDAELAWNYELAAGAAFLGFHIQREGASLPVHPLTSEAFDRISAGVLERVRNLRSNRQSASQVRLDTEGETGQSNLPASSDSSSSRRAKPSDGGSTSSEAANGRGPAFFVAASGWLAAAAAVVVLLFRGSAGGGLDLPAPEAMRTDLIERGGDVFVVDFLVAGGEAEAFSGDVAWSDSANEGYMRFDGLEVNDPKSFQYQLWIFQSNDITSEPHPVDGGVFDVVQGSDVVVPIDANIRVDRASVFVVTKEEPGGVVVSSRERVVVAARRA